MMVIHKQSVNAYAGVQTLHIPRAAIILKVGEQHGQISIWYSHYNEGESIDRAITILATGEYNYVDQFLSNNEYLGTAVIGGSLVWHVFIEKV